MTGGKGTARCAAVLCGSSLKQKQLCALLRCSQQTYSDYECGKTDIPTEALILLADFYNTSTDYLLGRTNNPLPLFDLPN